MAVLQAAGLAHKYSNETDLLFSGIDIELKQGESLAVTGASGSGKTTLLNILSGFLNPVEGSVLFGDKSLRDMNAKEKRELYQKTFSFLYQDSLLLDEYTLEENCLMPLLMTGRKEPEGMLDALFGKLGIDGKQKSFPAEISGGERQRAALARALITEPKVLFADEPTGSLDAKNADQVGRLLLEQCTANGAILVLVTHDRVFAGMADRSLEIDKHKARQ